MTGKVIPFPTWRVKSRNKRLDPQARRERAAKAAATRARNIAREIELALPFMRRAHAARTQAEWLAIREEAIAAGSSRRGFMRALMTGKGRGGVQ